MVREHLLAATLETLERCAASQQTGPWQYHPISELSAAKADIDDAIRCTFEDGTIEPRAAARWRRAYPYLACFRQHADVELMNAVEQTFARGKPRLVFQALDRDADAIDRVVLEFNAEHATREHQIEILYRRLEPAVSHL